MATGWLLPLLQCTMGKHTVFCIFVKPKSKSKVKSKVKSKSQVKSQKLKGLSLRTWTLHTLLSLLHPPPPPPTINFSDNSRGPTTKCYTFLETSHDPRLRSQLRCKNFAIFLQPYFANPLKFKKSYHLLYLFGNLPWPLT